MHWKEISAHPELYPVKLTFKNEGEIKIVSGEQEWANSSPARPVLMKNIKGCSSVTGKIIQSESSKTKKKKQVGRRVGN